MILEALPIPQHTPDIQTFKLVEQPGQNTGGELLKGAGTDFLLRRAGVTVLTVNSTPRPDHVSPWVRYDGQIRGLPPSLTLSKAGEAGPSNLLVAEPTSVTKAQLDNRTWRRVAGDSNLTPSDHTLKQAWIIHGLVKLARQAITSPRPEGHLINGGVKWVPKTLPLGWVMNQKPATETEPLGESNNLYVAVHPVILPEIQAVISRARDAYTLVEEPPDDPYGDFEYRTEWQQETRNYINEMGANGPEGIDRLAEMVVVGMVVAALPNEAKSRYISPPQDIERLAA